MWLPEKPRGPQCERDGGGPTGPAMAEDEQGLISPQQEGGGGGLLERADVKLLHQLRQLHKLLRRLHRCQSLMQRHCRPLSLARVVGHLPGAHGEFHEPVLSDGRLEHDLMLPLLLGKRPGLPALSHSRRKGSKSLPDPLAQSCLHRPALVHVVLCQRLAFPQHRLPDGQSLGRESEVRRDEFQRSRLGRMFEFERLELHPLVVDCNHRRHVHTVNTRALFSSSPPLHERLQVMVNSVPQFILLKIFGSDRALLDQRVDRAPGARRLAEGCAEGFFDSAPLLLESEPEEAGRRKGRQEGDGLMRKLLLCLLTYDIDDERSGGEDLALRNDLEQIERSAGTKKLGNFFVGLLELDLTFHESEVCVDHMMQLLQLFFEISIQDHCT
mmetsp:Transcript_24342/g.54833  ORF Transcript_24342/g.54833 Transcript_24342/m.54833 type:complete len:384 (+) Transcript_24342:3706-4857(+)